MEYISTGPAVPTRPADHGARAELRKRTRSHGPRGRPNGFLTPGRKDTGIGPQGAVESEPCQAERSKPCLRKLGRVPSVNRKQHKIFQVSTVGFHSLTVSEVL